MLEIRTNESEAAAKIIVIGIGGSYLGARAAIEFLHSPYYNAIKKEGPEIYFAGNSISGSYLSDIIKLCEGKRVSVNIISKSGTTTEPAIAFRVFRKWLEENYGVEEARKRIYCTTDKARGTLKQLADQKGYECFVDVLEDHAVEHLTAEVKTCCGSGNGTFVLCEDCLEILFILFCHLFLYPIWNRSLTESEEGLLEVFVASVIEETKCSSA